MFLVTSNEMKQMDRVSIRFFGLSEKLLMENAGRGVANYFLELFNDKCNKKIGILAGPGNNGGDSFVVARYLNQKGFFVTVFLLSRLDKIIFGGPMTGSCIYSETQPILPNTECIFVQNKKDIYNYEYNSCINCGECIRICPANIPINILIRFLQANQYEEGANLYNLHSCIECGLCSYVCTSKIPIFQYIKLAKYELNRISDTEVVNE